MRKAIWLPLAVTVTLTAGLVAVLAPFSRSAQAQPVGVPDKATQQAMQQAMQQMMQQQRAEQPELLVDGDSLYVVDREWLFQFNKATLELKNMQNLELLRHEFMQRMQKEGRLPGGQ
jgi:hypothetical protein